MSKTIIRHVYTGKDPDAIAKAIRIVLAEPKRELPIEAKVSQSPAASSLVRLSKIDL